MANQKILATAFALMVSSVNADNCLTASGGEYKLVASLTAKYCTSDSLACTTGKDGKCDCGSACCEKVPNLCGSMTGTCETGHYEDDGKKMVAATAATFKTACCTAMKMCDITCPAGMKDKAGKATIKCQGSTCGSSECCEPDATKCMGLTVSNSACDAGHYADNDKVGVAATATTYTSSCCTAKKMCDFTCSAGMKNKAAYATTKCASTCSASECCDAVTTPMCMNHAVAAGKGCAATEFPSMSATAVKADSSDYKTLCCTAKATCEAFAASKLASSASGAVKQQAVSFAMVAIAGLVAVAM